MSATTFAADMAAAKAERAAERLGALRAVPERLEWRFASVETDGGLTVMEHWSPVKVVERFEDRLALRIMWQDGITSDLSLSWYEDQYERGNVRRRE